MTSLKASLRQLAGSAKRDFQDLQSGGGRKCIL